jgi:amino acid adenylation domain-containing protein
VALRLRGRLNIERFADAFRGIVRRHEALRTSFRSEDGRPVQIIEPIGDTVLEVPFEDLSGLPAGEREARLAELAEEEARRPFDLRRAPLLRVRVVGLEEEDHAVLVTFHHVVSDGWSMGVLVNEVAALYAGSELPELPIQYADFAVWQRGRLTGEWLEAEVEHWRSALDGTSTVLDLPADRPRPAVQSFRGRHLPVELPAALTEGVKALALRDGSTPFMVLLAGFEALLHRYTGQEDFLVGSPVANRTRQELEGLIGFFVNTLALRARLGGEPSFDELTGRVRQVTLDAYAHQDLPFERLVEALEPRRDLSRSPLFQVLFVLQNAPFEPLELPELTLEPLELESGTSKFDLSLYLMERPDGPLGGFLEINTDLFEEATAFRMMDHFRTLLESAVASPEARISELALLSEAERRQVLEGWNGAETELPEVTVASLFREQAKRTPEAVALVQGEERLTYAELDRRSGLLAGWLREQGVGPESKVGIALERTPDLVLAVLGVLRSGGAYVPLDPSHPRERLDLILEAARPQLVLTALPDLGVEGVPSPAHPAQRARDGEGSSLAYVLFTSGSTGRPKGVQIPQRALVNFLLSMAREPGLDASDTLLAVTTLSFDIAGLELLLPLILGARVELATREEAADAGLLGNLLSGATVLQATPATWRMLLDAGWEGDGRLKALCGGEALPSELAARLLPRVGSLWNLYGPTETTIWSAVRQVTAGEEGASLAVGGAIANTSLYVLDRRLEPAPVGVPGELCIGGAGLARGYLDAPDLTAERFVPDPFSHRRGGRMYRTGDLVRWRPDGRIEFLGRIDFQVKVRGFRIELGELEAALASHPSVRQAVAGVRGQSLVAWIVGDAPARELREHLKGKLPEYMVPSSFVTLDAFPLTPSGKVDRKALPEPEAARDRQHLAPIPPRGPVEELIAGLWSELLGVSRVGAEDSFFELGGHSLLATQLVSRLRRAFGVEVPVRQLFETPTVAGLAGAVQAARQGSPAPPIRPVPRDREIPLSFAQERLWFLEQLEREDSLNNLPAAVRLRGDLRIDALEASLREIVRRHESLRTRFVAVHGRPVQVVDPDWRPSLPVVDLCGLPPAVLDAELHRSLHSQESRPYDLARGPLLRATLLRLSDGESVFLFEMHHVISDRWSLGILLREMAALYPALAAGGPSPLPELRVQYPDYSVWQREWLSGEVLESQLGYWKRQLAGLPRLEIPTDRSPQGAGSQAADLVFELEAPLAAGIDALARRHGASPFMIFLTAIQALLHRHSGQDDVAVGAPIAGRNRAEAEDLIGFFVNTLVLRSRIEGNPSFLELLERVRTTTLDAYDRQDVPFSRVVEAVRPDRSQGSHGMALVEVMFTLQNQPIPELSLPGLQLSAMPLHDDVDMRIDFSLAFRVWEDRGRVTGGLSYNAGRFDRATAERWRDNFLTLLAALVETPERPFREVPLLSVGERRQAPAQDAAAPAVSEAVGRQRAELSGRRDHLSAAKRELLEKRLRGAKTGSPATPSTPRAPKLLVKLQEGDGKLPPLFLVHAVGGAVFSYGEIARRLGPGQTLYGVQSPGLDGGEAIEDIPAMAAEYAAAVEATTPRGPILLGGWSFGGVVAFEMARQLRAKGREVPLVALLDSHVPTGNDLLAGRSDAELLLPVLRDQAGIQQGQQGQQGAEWLDQMPFEGEHAMERLLAQAREAGVLRADVKSDRIERLLGVYKANLRALAAYRPQTYEGKLALFRSRSAEAYSSADAWAAYTGEPLEIHEVDGDHYTMLTAPHVLDLAQRLAASIGRSLRAGAEAVV